MREDRTSHGHGITSIGQAPVTVSELSNLETSKQFYTVMLHVLRWPNCHAIANTRKDDTNTVLPLLAIS